MELKVNEMPAVAGSLIRQFDIEVPHAEIAMRLDKAVAELAPQVELKGFRKGHVPESQVRERYGEELVGKILEELIAETSREALKDKKLELALQPHAHLNSEVRDILGGADLKYKITAELQPEFELTDISKLELEKITTEIKDEHITQALNDIVSRNPMFEDDEAGRAAQAGDKVIIDIVGTIDGKPFENNESKDMPLHLGKGQLHENIEKGVIGKSAEDKFNVPLGFPADHSNKVIAGKLANFAVHLKSVVAERAPVVDEIFAKALGTKSVEELRQKVRDEMGKGDEAMARTNLKQQISEKLSTQDFDLPPSLLEQEKGAMMNQIMAMQQQLPPEEQKKAQAQMAQVEQNINEMAKKRVKIALVLSRIAKEKEIDVERDDLKAAIEEDIQRYAGGNPEQMAQIKKLYSENPEMTQRIYAQLLEEKTIDAIIKVAQIKDKPMKREEVYKPEAENPPPAPDAKQSLTDFRA